MESIGRYLILGGLLLALIGGALYVSGRLGLPLGRLPGDIRIKWRGGGRSLSTRHKHPHLRRLNCCSEYSGSVLS